MNSMKKILYLIIFACSSIYSQTSQKNLKIYLNCNYCYETYIKQNLNYVEFVRDQNFADVQLMFRTQKTGGGGSQYEIEFMGQHRFSEIQDKIIFNSEADDTANEIRNLILKHIKLGLVRYWIKNSDQANIEITQKENKDKTADKDPWNKWVFKLGVSGNISGEETSKYRGINFNFSVKQVTAHNKFLLWVSISPLLFMKKIKLLAVTRLKQFG